GISNDPATISQRSRDPLPYGSPLSFETGRWTGRRRKGQKRIGGGAGDRPKERGRRVFARRIGARGGAVGRGRRSFLESNKARAEFSRRVSGARDGVCGSGRVCASDNALGDLREKAAGKSCGPLSIGRSL